MEIKSKSYLSSSWEMVIAGRELKRIGKIKKPLYVVPNNIVEQFQRDIEVACPHSNILVLDSKNLPLGEKTENETQKEYEARQAKRRTTLARIATGDWDFIVISHDMFQRLPMSAQFQAQFYNERIQELKDLKRIINESEDGRYGTTSAFHSKVHILKKITTAISNLEEQKNKAIEKALADEGTLPFDKLGIDQLFVDECDQFKNLFFKTSKEGVAGISTTGSGRAWDMYQKTEFLKQQRNGGGLVFASGTPVSNTLNEIFTLMRYLMPKEYLKQNGYSSFDEWAGLFARFKDSVELNVTGGYKLVKRIVLTNLLSLNQVIGDFMDYKAAEDLLHLERPKVVGGAKEGDYIGIVVKPTETQKRIFEQLIKRAEAIHGGGVDPAEDNMLKIMGEGRKLTIDARLLDPTIPEEEAGGKIPAVCENVAREYKESKDPKGTQVIFLDLGIPAKKDKGKKDNEEKDTNSDEDNENEEVEVLTKTDLKIYDLIKQGLIKRGIPAKEIAFVHDAGNDAQKRQALFDKFNKGEIRILLGSTQKMGAGTNFQQHLGVTHHIDVPWRPRDLEQRNGRMVRKGNLNKEVKIYTYIVEDILDSYNWERIEHKQAMINAFLKRNPGVTEIEDTNGLEMQAAEFVALGANNPLLKERALLEQKFKNLQLQRAVYEQNQIRISMEIDSLKARIKSDQTGDLKLDIKERVKVETGDAFRIKIGDTVYEKYSDAKAALEDLMKNFTATTPTKIGEIGGFDITACSVEVYTTQGTTAEHTGYRVALQLKNHRSYTISAEKDPIRAMANFINKGIETVLADTERLIEEDKAKIVEFEKQLKKPFDQEDELRAAEIKLKELDARIKNASKDQATQNQRGDFVNAVIRSFDQLSRSETTENDIAESDGETETDAAEKTVAELDSETAPETKNENTYAKIENKFPKVTYEWDTVKHDLYRVAGKLVSFKKAVEAAQKIYRAQKDFIFDEIEKKLGISTTKDYSSAEVALYIEFTEKEPDSYLKVLFKYGTIEFEDQAYFENFEDAAKAARYIEKNFNDIDSIRGSDEKYKKSKLGFLIGEKYVESFDSEEVKKIFEELDAETETTAPEETENAYAEIENKFPDVKATSSNNRDFYSIDGKRVSKEEAREVAKKISDAKTKFILDSLKKDTGINPKNTVGDGNNVLISFESPSGKFILNKEVLFENFEDAVKAARYIKENFDDVQFINVSENVSSYNTVFRINESGEHIETEDAKEKVAKMDTETEIPTTTSLKKIAQKISSEYGANFADTEKIIEKIFNAFKSDKKAVNAAKENTASMFEKIYYDKKFNDVVYDNLQQDSEFENFTAEYADVLETLKEDMFPAVYQNLRDDNVDNETAISAQAEQGSNENLDAESKKAYVELKNKLPKVSHTVDFDGDWGTGPFAERIDIYKIDEQRVSKEAAQKELKRVSDAKRKFIFDSVKKNLGIVPTDDSNKIFIGFYFKKDSRSDMSFWEGRNVNGIAEKFTHPASRYFETFEDAVRVARFIKNNFDDVGSIHVQTLDANPYFDFTIDEHGEHVESNFAKEKIAKMDTEKLNNKDKKSVRGDVSTEIKEIIDAKNLNSMQKAISDFSASMGVPVTFFKSDKRFHGAFKNSIFRNGKIFINADSETSYDWTFWHEAFHWMAAKNPALLKEIADAVGITKTQISGYRTKTKLAKLTDVQAVEEILADNMKDVASRAGLLQQVGKKNKSLVQRLISWLRSVLDKFTDFFNTPKNGLTREQKNKMYDTFGKMVRTITDSKGNAIFRYNNRTKAVELANGDALPDIEIEDGEALLEMKLSARDIETTMTAEEIQRNIEKGRSAIQKIIKNQGKVAKITAAMHRDDIGDIDILWGWKGDPANNFKNDYGISHILARREIKNLNGELVAQIMPDVIMKGKFVPDKDSTRIQLNYNGYTAILSKTWRGQPVNNWLLTGFVNAETEPSNERGEVYGSTVSTTRTPLRFQRTRDDDSASSESIPQFEDDGNTKYSINASDNSFAAFKKKLANKFFGERNKRFKLQMQDALEEITGYKISAGHLASGDIAVKPEAKVIRTRNKYAWENTPEFMPAVGKIVAEKLNLPPSEKMNNYIANWILDGAINDTSAESKEFQRAMRAADYDYREKLLDAQNKFISWDNKSAMEQLQEIVVSEREEKSFGEKYKSAREGFYAQFFEDIAPVKKLVDEVEKETGEKIPESKSPYIAFRNYKGMAGRAKMMLEGNKTTVKILQEAYPRINFNGFKTLKTILDEVGASTNNKIYHEFTAYVTACHLKEIHEKNKKNLEAQEKRQNKIEELQQKLQAAKNQEEIAALTDQLNFNKKKLAELKRNFYVTPFSEKKCDEIISGYGKKYSASQKDLVHFSNIMLAIITDSGIRNQFVYERLLKKWKNYVPLHRLFDENENLAFGDSLKTMEGSARDIIDPIQAIIKSTNSFIKRAEKNKAILLLAGLVRCHDGIGRLIEEVDGKAPDDRTTITFYENGVKKYLQTDEAVVKAVNNLTPPQINWFSRFLRIGTTMVRNFMTLLNPNFAIRNLARDMQDAYLYGGKYDKDRKLFNVVKDIIQVPALSIKYMYKGLRGRLDDDADFNEWMIHGGAQASFWSMDRDYTQASIKKLTRINPKEKTLYTRIKDKGAQALQLLQAFGEYSELGTRIAHYKKVKGLLAKQHGGKNTYNDLVTAAYESRDLMDFARGGSSSRTWNVLTAFANAHLQGIDKFRRTFSTDHLKTAEGRKELSYSVLRLMISAVLPAMILFLMNHDKDWYKKDLNDYERRGHWIIGENLRVPKGMDFGIRFVSNLTEDFLNWASNNKKVDFTETFIKPLQDEVPDMLPTLLQPILEASMNYDMFTKNPVVPRRLQNLPEHLQYDDRTPSIAKYLGEKTGYSPKKIEHILFGFTGNIGKGTMRVADTVVGDKKFALPPADWLPLVGGFFRIPYRNPKIINDYYEQLDAQTKWYNEYKLTGKKPEGFNEPLYNRIKKVQKEMKKFSQLERAAVENPNLDNAEKDRRQIAIQKKRIALVEKVMR